MKVALVTDLHSGARNDSLLFNDYFIKFFTEQFFPYLNDNKITDIVILGDIFDRRKYVNFNTLSSWRKNIFSVLNKYNVHIILGNHDCYFKSTNDVNSIEELLGHYENIKIVDKPIDVKFGKMNIFMLPWITEENNVEFTKAIELTKSNIMFGHLEVIGFDMYRGLVNESTGFNPSDLDKFDMVCSGHYHHRSSKRNIHYLGTPYEILWHDAEDPRGFHVLDTDTEKLEFIENPLKIHHKLSYDDTDKTFEDIISGLDFKLYENSYVKLIVKHKNNPYIFDQFIEELYKHNPADLTVVDEIIDSSTSEDAIDETKDTLTLLLEYVESMGVSPENKKPLNDLLTSIYKEASELDV